MLFIKPTKKFQRVEGGILSYDFEAGSNPPDRPSCVTPTPARKLLDHPSGRGAAEQWIKEGKYAMNWTRLSCHKFVANQVRLWLFILAFNLGNLVRRLALPEGIKHWSLTSIQTRLTH